MVHYIFFVSLPLISCPAIIELQDEISKNVVRVYHLKSVLLIAASELFL